MYGLVKNSRLRIKNVRIPDQAVFPIKQEKHNGSRETAERHYQLVRGALSTYLRSFGLMARMPVSYD